jgi:rare lipoprotein A
MQLKFFVIILIFLIPFGFIIAQETGMASYYGHKLSGRRTSDGSQYHPDSLTCAHKTYPFGTKLLVRNPKNNTQVVVKVTDRGPHTRNRLIDLSYKAARELDIIRQGIALVEITRVANWWEFTRIIAPPPPYPLQTKSFNFLIPDIFKTLQIQSR